MKKIVAINASPRLTWNTGTLVCEAARGAENAGAEIIRFDLYRLEPYSGCISCFGCKLPEHQGVCVCKDGLSPVLKAIRHADGLIIGTPNYLGDVSAAFRALYERLIFRSLTYKTEPRCYNTRRIPVLLIMTSNAAQTFYPQLGYDQMLARYQQTLNAMVGPAKLMICGDTLQVNDYERYDWTMFDAQAKRARHEAVFPEEMKKACGLGAEMVSGAWDTL
ncbi:MAG: flavodoxin family protein [Ruminococcaceae bacterium]|nr:flavodoxin family protein [Oscillospiraceae bacterium]